MPKEAVIRKKVIETLSQDGWICWYPFKARYAKEVDIFGVFDVIAVHAHGLIKLIQLTDYTSVSKRIKKIEGWLNANEICTCAFAQTEFEVWGWNKNKKEFRIVKL